MRKWEMDKEALKAERRRKVRWMRSGSAWSSAVEPDLSPIEGSSAATTPGEADDSTETVVRTPSGREESSDYIGRFGDHEGEQAGTFSPFRPEATFSLLPTNTVNNHIRRKPVPGSSRPPILNEPGSRAAATTRHTISFQESSNQLIPVESDCPPQPPPKVGPKPVG